MSGAGTAAGIVKINNLSEAQRFRVIEDLLSGSTKGKLAHGDLGRIAEVFRSNAKQLSRVWKWYQRWNDDAVVKITVADKHKASSGQHRLEIEIVHQKRKKLPMKSPFYAGTRMSCRSPTRYSTTTSNSSA